jgi:hypothetical protein
VSPTLHVNLTLYIIPSLKIRHCKLAMLQLLSLN